MSTGIRGFVFLWLGALAFSRAAGSVQVDDLLLKARSAGTVRIIVGLDVPFTPEGGLDALGASAQRQVIEESQSSLLSALAGTEARLLAQFRYIPAVALEVDAGTLATLASLPGVNAVEEDRVGSPALASSNQVIGSPNAWAGSFTGFGQVVAILDTGVDTTHSFFTTGSTKVVSEACYSTNSGISTSVCPGGVSSSTAPGSGVHCPAAVLGCDHGTHVAGIAAGYNGGPNQGVARSANVISIQVFSRWLDPVVCGGATPCARVFTTDMIRGLERVFELRTTFNIASANLSLVFDPFSAPCDTVSPAAKAAIDNLRSVRIATIAASGNNGSRDAMTFPACISTAVSVGATDDLDNVAAFSDVASFLDLLAPGVSIDSAVPGGGIATFQGTSMAAPHVAGAWAILKEASPQAAVDDVLSALRISGTPVDDNRPGGTVHRIPRINIDDALKYSDAVLVVDDDNDNPDMLSRYLVPLSQLGVTSRFWSTQVSLTEPGPEILNLFSKVLWFTGASFDSSTGPSSAGEAALVSYLSNRGCLLLTSQDYLSARGQTSFMTSFLGMASGQSDVGQTSVTGQGSFFGQLGSQTLVYLFPNLSDRISPDATATVAFLGNAAEAGAMKNTGVYRTAFLGFPLEALPSAATRRQAIDAGLQFCDTIFSDVSSGYWAKRWIEAASLSGITGGCSTVPFNYCPESLITREQMAVFLLKAKEGPNYVPPPCSGAPFADVPASSPFCRWIMELAQRGITSGCGAGSFCPTGNVTREQMAIFLLKTKEGAGYVPPPCTAAPFADVPAASPFCPWIQELVRRGITGGCSPGLYCPGNPSTRAQMAVFLVTNFGLPLP